MTLYTIILYIHRERKKQTKLVNRTPFTGGGGGEAVEIYIEFRGGRGVVGIQGAYVHNVHTHTHTHTQPYMNPTAAGCILTLLCACVYYLYIYLYEGGKKTRRKEKNE